MKKNERRHRTKVKLMERERMMRFLGLQAGSIYQKHRDKVQRSSGYMHCGNVSHYVSTYPCRKTRSRNRYASPFTPPIREAARIQSMDEQMKERMIPLNE